MEMINTNHKYTNNDNDINNKNHTHDTNNT